MLCYCVAFPVTEHTLLLLTLFARHRHNLRPNACNGSAIITNLNMLVCMQTISDKCLSVGLLVMRRKRSLFCHILHASLLPPPESAPSLARSRANEQKTESIYIFPHQALLGGCLQLIIIHNAGEASPSLCHVTLSAGRI